MYEVYAGLLKEDIQLTIDGQRISALPSPPFWKLPA